MKINYRTFNLVMLFVISIFLNSNAQNQRFNQPNSFYENIEHYNYTITSESLIRYDSTALDSFFLSKMDQYFIPGLSACIVKDDQIIWKGAFGYANIEQNKMVTDSTLFYLASLSKPVVATAVMQLWEEGMFGLDDNVNFYLPFLVRNPNYPVTPITFQMLLTHTSSIKDNWNIFDQLYVWGYDSPIALDSFLINYLVPGGLYYSSANYNTLLPGSQWEYSNVGAALLAHLVETISNNSFEQYCQDSIFIPLGMNETSWFLANLDPNHIAMPYHYSGGSYIPYDQAGAPLYPAVQLRTSAIQYSRFISSYIQMGQYKGARILNNATVNLITSVQDSAIAPTQGLIWFMAPFNIPKVGTRTICYHRGRWYGASNLMAYIKGTDENVGAIFFTNSEIDEQLIGMGLEQMAYGLLYNKIYAHNIKLNSYFMEVNTDTLILTTEFVNPNDHNFSANAIITSIDSTYNVSIPLYNDGNHGDLQAGDGIWGNYILPISIEDEFLVGFSTTDLVSGSHLNQNSQARFTTIGPVEFDFYEITSSDTLPNPGDRLNFRLYLKNNGISATAPNITAQLSTTDSMVQFPITPKDYGDIAVGSTVPSTTTYRINFLDNLEESRYVHFYLQIASNGLFYWSDSFAVWVEVPTGIAVEQEKIPTDFALNQNYPNPFNPATTIKFDLPKMSEVTLKIFNILGEEVVTLVSENLSAGSYSYEWDASDLPSGVYLYRLEAEEYVDIKKMILLR